MKDEGKIDIKKSEIVLKHDGYSRNVVNNKRKVERNLKLTKQTMKREPSNSRWAYFYFRDGIDLIDSNEAIIKLKNFIDKEEKTNDKVYYIALIDLLARYELRNLSDEQSFNETIKLLNKVEPYNSNSIFYQELYKLRKWKKLAEKTLHSLLEHREKNNHDIPEMLHVKGFHIDSIIAMYLFECGYYKQAKEMLEWLQAQNYTPEINNIYISILNKMIFTKSDN